MRYFLLLVAAVAAGCSKPEPAKLTQAQADLAACRDAIRSRLVDPDSVKFTDEAPVPGRDGERGYTLTFNAKNRMGGFAGPQPLGCWVDAATGQVKSLT